VLTAIAVVPEAAHAESATPAALHFGSAGINTTKTLTSVITIDAGYQLSGASGTGINPPFALALNGCNLFKGPGHCTLTEKFTPAAPGAATGVTHIAECPTGGGGVCKSIDLDVDGTGVVNFAVTPPTVHFGSVAINITKTLTSKVTVDAGYTLSSASGTGINPPWSVPVTACKQFKRPGHCLLPEKFRPTAAGLATGVTWISECPTGGGGVCKSIDLDVDGTGIVNFAITPATVHFGSVTINTTKTLTSKVTVDAGYTLSSASGTGINPPWSVPVTACKQFKGPGHCTWTEKFTPTAPGLATGVTWIAECPTGGGGVCKTIDLDIDGTGTP
jgi:hypothetical protein